MNNKGLLGLSTLAVTFYYGMYHCLNFVTEAEGRAGAVLIRALEPTEGLAVMARRRGLNPQSIRRRDLTTGPGKLCQALGLDAAWNGVPVAADQQRDDESRFMTVTAATPPVTWQAGPRIGITRATDWPHRFVDPQSNCLSR